MRAVAIAGAAAIALGLAGCGNVDAGTGAVAQLRSIVDRWDETLTVDSSALNTLPWSGEASATVVVDEDTATSRVEDMAGELGAFLEDADGGTARWEYLDLQVGGFRFTVAEAEASRTQNVAAFEALRSEERVVGGFVRAAEDALVSVEEDAPVDPASARVLGGTVGSVRAVIRGDVPLADGYDLARGAAGLVDALAERAVVAESEDGRSAVSDSSGVDGDTARSDPPDTTLALAAAVGRTATVADVIATADALTVRLADPADVTAVRDTFDERAVTLGISFTVNGGVVTDDGSIGDDGLAVARSLDGADGVLAVDVRGSEVAVTLADASSVGPTVETLLAQPDIEAIPSVLLATSDDGAAGFSVAGPPDQLARLGELVVAGSEHEVMTRLEVEGSVTRLELQSEPDIEALRSLFSALRPSLVDGETLQISADRVGGFTVDVEFTIGDEIVPSISRSAGDEIAELAARAAIAWSAS